MIIDFHQIQDQFHASKRQTSPLVIEVDPFTCYLHPEFGAHYENYAVPHKDSSTRLANGIPGLIETFYQYDRRPRLEYIEACAPLLESALLNAGFQVESRSILMVCTAEILQEPAIPPGLELSVLGPDGRLEDYRQFKTVEKRSFWQADAPEATLADAEEAYRRYGELLKVTAKLGGNIVGIGSITFPHEGIAEAAGIATLPTHRRKGIAGALTARLCLEAFKRDIQLVFLTAADENAGRVYTRAGFIPTGTTQINASIPD